MPQNRNADALPILKRLYVKGSPSREASLEKERERLRIAQRIHEIRTTAHLSQAELARRVGTTQSVISRLENADYRGHSIPMLARIAEVLGHSLSVDMTQTGAASVSCLPHVFRLLLRDLRRRKKMSIDTLAAETGIDRAELTAMEQVEGHRPSPSALQTLAAYHDIPPQRLAELAGLFRVIPKEVQDSARRFVERSGALASLTREEKRAVDELVSSLRKEG